MELPSQFYDLVLDLTERRLIVILDQQALPTDEVVSEDGLSSVGFLIADDDLPYVADVTILDPNKITVLQDWIEEAIMTATESLNARRSDNYGENHWKGFRGGTAEGRLSSVVVEG